MSQFPSETTTDQVSPPNSGLCSQLRTTELDRGQIILITFWKGLISDASFSLIRILCLSNIYRCAQFFTWTRERLDICIRNDTSQSTWNKSLKVFFLFIRPHQRAWLVKSHIKAQKHMITHRTQTPVLQMTIQHNHSANTTNKMTDCSLSPFIIPSDFLRFYGRTFPI